MKKALIAICLTLASSAFAQNVQQSGTVTNKHIPYWVTSGVIGDGGSATDSPISSIGVTNNGGAGICISSDRQTNPRNQLCFGAQTNGPATISLQNYGNAPAETLNYVINGMVSTSLLVTGTPAVNGVAAFASGQVIQDSGLTALGGTITSGTWNGAPVGISFGGTGATSAANARTNLGLGSMAVQNASAVAITGGTVTGLPTPTNPSDAAIKSYVDANTSGLIILPQSTLATAAVLPNSPTYNNGAAGVGATLTAGSNTALTVDGTAAPLNTVVLVKNQAAPAQNGIYTVTTAGSGAAAWVLTRATYFDQGTTEMKVGSYTFINSGTVNSNSSWTLATTVTTVGTDPANFNQFSSTIAGVGSIGGVSGTVLVDSSLQVTGQTLSVNSYNVYNVEVYGAKADLVAFQDGAITASTATFNSASATFSSADIGKLIAVKGAGAGGALLATTIAGYSGNPHQVALTINAGTTVSGANFAYSTDSTAGIQAAANLAMVSGGDVTFNSGGQYGVTGINLTNPAKAIRLLGVGALSWGTHIIAMSNANAIVDATGHDAIQIDNITIGSGYPDGTDIARPNIGILIAPSASIHGIDVISMHNVRVTGFYGTATFYMDRIYGAVIENSSSFQYNDAAASGFFMTGTNISGVTSSFTTTCNAACNGSIGSFTFLRDEFHNFGFTPFARSSMFLDAVVDSTWVSGLVSGNGTTITPSNNPTGLLFEGTQFSADNTTISSVFGAGALNYVTMINTNAGGVAYGGTITHFTPIGRQ